MSEAGQKFLEASDQAGDVRGSRQPYLREKSLDNSGLITGKAGRRSGCSLFPVPCSSPQSGVTLIELLVVVTIIALFAALVGPRLFKHVGKSRATAAHAQISAFQTALGVYKLDTGTFPKTEQGLEALRKKPEGVERWDGPYLPQDIPLDPWSRPYIYKFPGEHGDEPDVISYGNDGRPGGEGEDADILSWTSKSE